MPSSSTTRRTTAYPRFSTPRISTIRCISRSDETAAKLIATGKQATPITLRTFFESAEPVDGGRTVPQYLGSLATNAATIINARDYGRTIYDLAQRRQLILIGEDMVNVAYDSPVDFPPKEQIEEAETRLFALAETGKYGQGFSAFASALTTAIEMANKAYQREGGLSGIASGLKALDAKLGGTPALRSRYSRRPSFDGKDRPGNQHRL